MAPRYNINHASPPPFMTCVVKVSTQSYGRGQRTLSKVLDKCQGVHNFRMDGNGVVEISGTVDPSELLKTLGRAGRSAEICWLQFGECSNNLFMPSGYSHDGRYLQAPNVYRPKPPSITAHGYGYDQYGNSSGYSSYGSRRAGYQLGYHAPAPAHAHGCSSYDDRHEDTRESYRYGGNQTSTRSSTPDDICCTIM